MDSILQFHMAETNLPSLRWTLLGARHSTVETGFPFIGSPFEQLFTERLLYVKKLSVDWIYINEQI